MQLFFDLNGYFFRKRVKKRQLGLFFVRNCAQGTLSRFNRPGGLLSSSGIHELRRRRDTMKGRWAKYVVTGAMLAMLAA
ncbi:hypothetical protein V3G49_22480, partial [Escherichia coli]|uniref:hypothetical protein n=1 Tax=Escherichia coli TaxID=562 RepID=UPI002F25EECB